MKITSLEVYQTFLPLVDGSYAWSDGKSVDQYDSTVVIIHTDTGLQGCGEAVPLGPNYLPSYAAGVRAGIRELGPKLIGQDPTQLETLNHHMDYHLKGHPYVKTAIDMACWDILGKVSGLPINTLMGGNFHPEGIPLYRAISQGTPEEMASTIRKYKDQGYTRFQLKLGGDPDVDIVRIKRCRAELDRSDILIGDSNTGWTTHQALRIVAAVRNEDVYIEQPCPSYQECLMVRRHTDLPFVLDEVVDDIHSLLAVHKDGAADVVNIKISKFGGLTKARQAVNLCQRLGLAATIEDTWGGDISTAAILHLSHSMPSKLCFTVTDFNSYNTVHTGSLSGVKKAGGRMTLPSGPGLGVEPNMQVLGKPIFVIN